MDELEVHSYTIILFVSPTTRPWSVSTRSLSLGCPTHVGLRPTVHPKLGYMPWHANQLPCKFVVYDIIYHVACGIIISS